MLAPLDGYFETLIASGRYAALGYRGWSLIDGFRAAALSFAVALWLIRWAAGDDLRSNEIIPIIGGLDRSQGYAPLTGARHRRRVTTLTQDGQLQRLVVWYAVNSELFFRRDDLQKLDRRLAVAVDQSRAAVGLNSLANAEELAEIIAGSDVPELEQFDLAKHVVLNQNPAQRR